MRKASVAICVFVAFLLGVIGGAAAAVLTFVAMFNFLRLLSWLMADEGWMNLMWFSILIIPIASLGVFAGVFSGTLLFVASKSSNSHNKHGFDVPREQD